MTWSLPWYFVKPFLHGVMVAIAGACGLGAAIAPLTPEPSSWAMLVALAAVASSVAVALRIEVAI